MWVDKGVSAVLRQTAAGAAINANTTGVKRVEAWDGWRGTAILMVLCGHFYDIGWVWEDRMGVDVFFVLSGMLMSVILFEKRLSLKDFYIRRLSRIYPALLFFVVAMFVFSWLFSRSFTIGEFFSSLLFLRTYYPVEPGIWSSEVTVAHLWSLNVEEHAYVVMSLLTLVLVDRKYVGWLLLALAAGSILLGFYYYNKLSDDDFFLYLIRTESAVVFVFMSAGYGLLRRQANWTVHSSVPVICFFAAFVCYAQDLPIWLVFSVSPVLLAIAVNHLDSVPRAVNGFLSLKPIKYIGLWSYSIYLWQQFFFEYNWIYPGGLGTALVLSVLSGMLSYYLLENPVRHWINNKWSSNPIYRA